jgi:hypothetical protein
MAYDRSFLSFSPRTRRVLGWIGVTIIAAAAGFWAYWGINENFHEGWYSPSLWDNLVMMVGQYLLLALVFTALGIVAIRWNRVGAILNLVIGLFSIWFFRGASLPVHVTIFGFFALIAFFFAAGRPAPRRLAYGIIVAIPLLTMLGFAVEPVVRISERVNDGNFGARLVAGNGVTLVWAPRGPGYPEHGGTKWADAVRQCRYLSADGLSILQAPADIWRLPSVDEAVRSLTRHGQNAGGVWDRSSARATYAIQPDKETPLWDPHSMIIYWWSGDEADDTHAYRIIYNGLINTYLKQVAPDYFGFRCVKTP